MLLIYNSTAGEQIMSRTLVCTSIVMQRGRPFLAPLPSEEQLESPSKVRCRHERHGAVLDLVLSDTVKEEKVEESCPGKEVPSSGSTNFTLRSFPTGANPPSIQPLPYGPCLPPSPVVSPPLFIPPWIPLHQTQQFGQMPVANWVMCGGCQMWGAVVPFWAAQ